MDLRTAIYRYCNYQERCHKEVKNKLYELKASQEEINAITAELIENGLLNEERFAQAYTRGKFRIKEWGRVKIVAGLKAHHISEYCIKKALQEISDEEYAATLMREIEKALHRYRTLKPVRRQRDAAYKYLLSHGWEGGLILTMIKSLDEK